MERQPGWAIIGAGTIANEMATTFSEKGKRFLGIYNRTYEHAESFALKYGAERVYRSSADLCADPDVDIVYIATPHNTHYGYIKECLIAGKHVLAEKSITLNSAQLDELYGTAEGKGLILAEAQTIYHMPLFKELWAMKDSGELGRVKVISANFGSFKQYDMNNRFFNMALGGGALLDIGVYALSAVRSFMDQDPSKVFSVMVPSPAGSDEMSAVALATDSGQVATVALSMHAKQPKRIMISFDKGYIEIPNYPKAENAYLTLTESGETKEIRAGRSSMAYAYETEDMEEAVRRGDPSLMKTELTKNVMHIMSSIREEWGLKYPEEEENGGIS